MIVLIGILQCYREDYFRYPEVINEDASEFKYTLDYCRRDIALEFGGISDIQTYLNIWTSLMKLYNKPTSIDENSKEFELWCYNKNLNVIAWRRVLLWLNHFYQIIKFDEITFDPTEFVQLIRPIFIQCYSDQIFKLISKQGHPPTYIDTKTKDHFILSTFQSINLFQQNPTPSIISLLTSQIYSIYPTVNIINIFIDIP